MGLDLLGLACLWILAIVVVDPRGDFPLNDDWSYGKAVRDLISNGTFHPTGWTAMPLLTPVLWGALFCLPFGFSFTALRFATLALGLLGACSCYLLLRQAALPRSVSMAGTLVLAFNPIYFALSYTFMTDVPFLGFLLLGALFLARDLQSRSDPGLILGTLFSMSAVLCRQLGLFLPIAFAATVLVVRGVSAKTVSRASAPVILSLAGLWGFGSFLKTTVGLPTLYNSQTVSLWATLKDTERLGWILEWNLVKAIMYLGLFLFPFLLLMPNPFRPLRGRTTVVSLALTILFVATAIREMIGAKTIMPLGGNILTEGGIGPVALRDVYILELPHARILPPAFWAVLTAVSLIGGALALAWSCRAAVHLVDRKSGAHAGGSKAVALFAAAGIVCYGAPVFLTDYFDRYLIPLLPCIILMWSAAVSWTAVWKSTWKGVFAALLIAGMSVFSVAGTRDYLTLNRTRWEAVHTLMTEESVEPTQIDGGFEFNGWYLYDPLYAASPNKSWWWVHEDEYAVTMGPLEGYEVFREYSFARWLIPGRESIVILRRRAP